jgi:SAM-dependent methyltransferase
VVEIGAGTGANLAHYPATLTEVIATEPDPHMLRRASDAAAAAPVPVRLLRAPGERLPLDDATADTVVSTLVLCSVRDQARVLAEVRRVLKPDGALLLWEHVRAPNGGRLVRWQDRLERPWGFVAGGCHPNRDTVAAVESAGFAFERLDRFDFGPPPVKPHVAGLARPHPSR